MRFKTLIDNKTDEFIVIISFGEFKKAELGTSATPVLFPMTATKKGIENYYGNDFSLDGIDLIEVELKNHYQLRNI